MVVRRAQGFFNQYVRERGYFGCSLRERGDFQDIAEEDADVFATLKARQELRDIGLQRAGAETSERFTEVFARKAAIKGLRPQKGTQQVRVLQQGFTKEVAIAENDQSVMQERRMLLE